MITTINEPSKSVRGYAGLDGWSVVVVGDQKTPDDWFVPGVTFISFKDTESRDSTFERLLPVDHYSRKMLGYLWAIRAGAPIIVDTDDDNDPYESWGWPEFFAGHKTIPAERGFVNVYRLFTHQHIWPRGFPLERILDPTALVGPHEIEPQQIEVGIWQALADGDPDVDAIYRLTISSPCTFDAKEPVVLDRGTICPINSQNTAFRAEVFPLLYLPAYVPFRFTDILRGLVAQPILWETPFRTGFTRATVYQDRNPHDYLADFVSEIPSYRYAQEVVDTVRDAVTATETLSGNLYNSYVALVRSGIVPNEEIALLEAWLDETADVPVS